MLNILRTNGVFIVIFLLAFFLRAQEVLTNNYLFLLDQGRDMMAVKKIVFDHDLIFIGPNTSLSGVFQGPLHYYLLAPLTYVFNGDPIGAMITMLIVSLLVIVIVYMFFLRYFGKTSALVASYLFTVSPEAIAAATYIWNPHPMWLLIVLTAFLLFLAENVSEKFHLLLWPAIILTFHFEMAFGVFLLVAVGIYIFGVRRNMTSRRYIFTGLLLSGIFLLPQILFDVRNDFLMSRSVTRVITGTSDQGLYAGNEHQTYISLMRGHMNALANNFRSSFPQFGWYLWYPYGMGVSTISAAILLYRQHVFSQNELHLIRITSIIVLLIVGLTFLYPFPLRYWFLTGFQSLYLVLVAVIVGAMFRSGTTITFAAIVALSISLPYPIERLNVLYGNSTVETTSAKIQGKKEAFDFIYADANRKDFGLLVFTPPVLTDPYDYILFWYAAPKYGYKPHHEKRGLVYLLMEPDPSQYWSYKGWMETVVVDGDVLEETTLPSGIIVQKRMFDSK